MIGLKRIPLLLLIGIGLLGSACGNDDDNGNGDGNADGNADGSADGNADGSDEWDGTCAEGGIFAGHNLTDVREGLKSEGACLGEADTAEACEINISALAATSGRACIAVPPAKFEECVRTGDGAKLKGIQDTATELSDACANCYVGSVVCSKNNCLTVCLDTTMQAECDTCRAEAGCTAAFYECSGFPTRQELNP